MEILFLLIIIVGFIGLTSNAFSTEGNISMAQNTNDLNISYNMTTWPTGDKIWNICRAVAFAEGANKPGDVPDRLNNPGDISDWGNVYGSEYHSGSYVTTFPDKVTGWNKLYDKINNIYLGYSSSYNPDWTWTRIAQTWAGNWQAWVDNVTSMLGVSSESTLRQYVEG